MADFASDHYKLLKQLKKEKLKKSQLTKEQIEDIEYLGKNGCISYEEVCENEDPLHITETFIFIKPQGKAIYETYVRNRRRWFIPVIISIAALIISILALYKTSLPVSIYLNDKIINNTTAITETTIPI